MGMKKSLNMKLVAQRKLLEEWSIIWCPKRLAEQTNMAAIKIVFMLGD